MCLIAVVVQAVVDAQVAVVVQAVVDAVAVVAQEQGAASGGDLPGDGPDGGNPGQITAGGACKVVGMTCLSDCDTRLDPASGSDSRSATAGA